MTDTIPISEPYLAGNERRYVNECLETGWISSQGPFIGRFEQMLADYHGVAHAIATSNCTTALHLALKALDIGPGDEVICPDLTFIAPANMIVLSGATLVLCDVDRQTLNLDPVLVERCITPKTKAIIVVHQFGHAAPMDELMALARPRGIRIVEDNAESPGGRYKGRLLGTFGDVSCFSFFANKVVTTGEGGAIITGDEAVANRCRELRDHGMSRFKKYYHVELGYNYRMTNMQAAVGVAQWEVFDQIAARRLDQMRRYCAALEGIRGVTPRGFAAWCTPVHWLMTVTLDDELDRDGLLAFMKEHRVDGRAMINPVHDARHFAAHYDAGEFPVSSRVSARSLHLPSATALTADQIDRVVALVGQFVAR